MSRWRTALWGLGGLAVAAYLASGVYVVQPDERGVVRWFGRAANAVPAGLHYALPWPFCAVDTPKTTGVRRLYVGLEPADRAAIAGGDIVAQARTLESDMLTGDVNILKVTLAVQYQVADPVAYLFAADDPEQLATSVVRGVLIELLSGTPVDDALTQGKAWLELEVRTRAQAILDRYGCGMQLVATNIESIAPPYLVMRAFQRVVEAKKNAETVRDEAHGYANRVIPQAYGEATTVREQAEGYRSARVGQARGDATRFTSVLAAYQREPAVFRERVLLDTLAEILPQVETYILDEKPGDPTTHLRLLEQKPAAIP